VARPRTAGVPPGPVNCCLIAVGWRSKAEFRGGRVAAVALAALRFRSGLWDWSRTYIAGVVNVTPDSFSDGGQFADVDAAIAHGRQLVDDGADLLDIGGESTRPGAVAVSAEQELARILPVIEGLVGVGVPLSVDTTKAEVARACIDAGVEVVNDVSGSVFDPDILVVAEDAAAYICGHVRGATISEVHASDNQSPSVESVAAELAARVTSLSPSLRSKTIVDPCLGFGKLQAANLDLCKHAGTLSDRVQCAVMIGASRKRFVAALSGHDAPVPVPVRDAATMGASLAAAASGAHVLRVHNVAMLAPALRLHEAVRRSGA